MAIRPLYAGDMPHTSEIFEDRLFTQYMHYAEMYFALAKKLSEELTPNEADEITTQMERLHEWLYDYVDKQPRILLSEIPGFFKAKLIETFQVLSQKYSALTKEPFEELTPNQADVKSAQIQRIREWLHEQVAGCPEFQLQEHLPEGYVLFSDDVRFAKIVNYSKTYCKFVKELAEGLAPWEARKKTEERNELYAYLQDQRPWLLEHLEKHPELRSRLPEEYQI